MELGEEFSIFDELFERIDGIAERPPDGRPHGEDWFPPPDGTRLTTIKEVGGKAVKFMIFSSETKSLEDGRNLYSPSITVFNGSGDSRTKIHIESSDLGKQPTGQTQSARHETMRNNLEEACVLLDQYENSYGA